jgi:GTP:adenosylcobinamide-phosphate guanylyltransferase
LSGTGTEPGAVSVILLAGRRKGGDPLARTLGLADKWLVEIGGKQMLARVLEALADCPRIGRIAIVTDAGQAALASAAAKRLEAEGRLRLLPPDGSPARSTLAALEQLEDAYPCLLTTADHALLNGGQVTEFLEHAQSLEADFVAALADVDALERRFPEVRRTAWRFKGERVAGCNLFLLKTPAANGLVSLWRSVEADRKRPHRILRRFGLKLLLGYLLGQLRLSQALARLGALAGCRVAAFRHPDPLVGIDVDSLEDLDLVERILAQRPAEAPAAEPSSQRETIA